MQGSNSGTPVDKQGVTEQDSQRDSQALFSSFSEDLKTVIRAWDTLPSALKWAVLTIVKSAPTASEAKVSVNY